ncbi:unnamed protein product [Meloidogyne enterolobii]|uniref:Uncharacterized protein n=1 Tax=Meloidogyne enterolobii TaxID=390850 RepID=A0ACB1AUR7_MELEN
MTEINAETGQDYTLYKLESCGSERFLKILPEYVDNIFSPKFTQSLFTTEIYHITGDGADGGVVYSEMYGKELNAELIVDRKRRELMHCTSKCGYAVDTGGRVENIRNEANIRSIIDYHGKNYHISNSVILL